MYFRFGLGPKALLVLGGLLANLIVGVVNLGMKLVWGQ